MRPSRVLTLSESALTELPPLDDLTELHTLDVGHNRLTSVPRLPDISGYLYVHDNALPSLPDTLCDLARLRYLNVSANPIHGSRLVSATCAGWLNYAPSAAG
jgi:Leucine-rich repeat (LRR) protein